MFHSVFLIVAFRNFWIPHKECKWGGGVIRGKAAKWKFKRNTLIWRIQTPTAGGGCPRAIPNCSFAASRNQHIFSDIQKRLLNLARSWKVSKPKNQNAVKAVKILRLKYKSTKFSVVIGPGVRWSGTAYNPSIQEAKQGEFESSRTARVTEWPHPEPTPQKVLGICFLKASTLLSDSHTRVGKWTQQPGLGEAL